MMLGTQTPHQDAHYVDLIGLILGAQILRLQNQLLSSPHPPSYWPGVAEAQVWTKESPKAAPAGGRAKSVTQSAGAWSGGAALRAHQESSGQFVRLNECAPCPE